MKTSKSMNLCMLLLFPSVASVAFLASSLVNPLRRFSLQIEDYMPPADSRYGPSDTFIGPLPPHTAHFIGPLPVTALQRVQYTLQRAGSSTTLTYSEADQGLTNLLDSNGDCIIDKKTFSYLPDARTSFTLPITPEDQTLFTNMITRAEKRQGEPSSIYLRF